ncbi:MAG: tRNA guanosine(34) transglycosylase Tgt [Planctomycetota bacterium]
MPLPFRLEVSDGTARSGVLSTARGDIETPAFMPVATRGVVKGILPGALKRLGASMILMNLYHLLERPGLETAERLGGIHAMFGWDGPILTDSGGYQVWSLSESVSISDEAVKFRSPYDGSERTLTPESAVESQSRLGADVAMALDDCPDPKAGADRIREAADRTIRWAKHCLEAARRPDCALFGIVQGGTDLALRREQASALSAMAFDGFGIGGLSLGEEKSSTWAALEALDATLPREKPRYLMGVGEPTDLLEGVERGVDLFDCVLPARVGRNGGFFTPDGRRQIRNAAFRDDASPLFGGCDCPACAPESGSADLGLPARKTPWSRAALHHFFRVGEMLGPILLSMHNIRFLLRLAASAREAVRAARFAAFKAEFTARYRAGE